MTQILSWIYTFKEKESHVRSYFFHRLLMETFFQTFFQPTWKSRIYSWLVSCPVPLPYKMLDSFEYTSA